MIKTKNKYIWFKKYKMIEVDNSLGLQLVFVDLGASIYSIKHNGKLVTFFNGSFKEFIHSGLYYGKTLGRTAGRIKNGTININDKEYHLYKFDKHTLHGGLGFSFKKYKVETFEDESECRIIFRGISPDNDNGYPGTLNHSITYIVSKKKNTFEIQFKAVSDKDTVCNLSNHVYFNLEKDNKKSILNETLFINSREYIVPDKELLFKEFGKCEREFNFKNGLQIGEYINDKVLQKLAHGYDHDFILDKEKDYDAILVSSNGRLALKITTSNPVLHLYTGNYFDKQNIYHGVALECEQAIYDPRRIILKKGQIYSEYIKYEFIEK